MENREKLTGIHAVIFDMDGVLIDTEKYLTRFWRQAALEAGYEIKEEHLLMMRSFASKYAAPRFQELYGPNFDYMAIRQRRKELMAEHLAQHGIEKKPWVDETLDALRKRGYKLAVATATSEERAFPYLEKIGILHKFDKIICASMVENGKPCPDIYLYACAQIDEKPENCIAVEDAPNGVLSAWRAGCHVVMVPDLSQPDDRLKTLIEKKADSLRELLDFL
ncbi:MAG: HAD family phosphatase [Eubacteriales bacterium]|nr:HAD family phosphatase [Eubacteriales bacterium]